MLGSGRWRRYTEDWKEEFRGRAIEHVLKYGHNFDALKSKNGRNNDPYNYFAMIIGNAFKQSWKKCKIYSDNVMTYNQDYSYENSLSEDQEFVEDHYKNPNIESLDWGSLE